MLNTSTSLFLRLSKLSTKHIVILKDSRICLTTISNRMVDITFKGHGDRYDGITVDSDVEPCQLPAFLKRLQASLEQWKKEKKRTIWFRISLPYASWIPILTENGFKFHNAREHHVTLYRWLSDDEFCNVPPYAHTLLGVGAFVYRENTNEVLVIKERHSPIVTLWKLPGGYLEPGENISDAAVREILEETGIQAEFKSLVTFRHGHKYAFGCSDIYMIAYMVPQTFEIQKCNQEISECIWMKLNEYAEHPEVHENNKEFARHFIDFLNHRKSIVVSYERHPLSKEPICVYSISTIPNKYRTPKMELKPSYKAHIQNRWIDMHMNVRTGYTSFTPRFNFSLSAAGSLWCSCLS
ncbi:nudix hydrolase 7 isoform X2 [Cephus cinctus]|uniref:Nucleoside diphosphate-linked moiety X motif 6 n=1 Tax=Cephus cinctus TaxID=211228 RepID=A0AAJ7R745_CEPCN|nr:nudix hydrolase 7 isoform X2 [Cephus cinctus]